MRRKWLAVALCLILALAIPGATLPGASAAASYDAVDDNVLGNATKFAYQNNLVRLTNGTYYAVYADNGTDGTTNISISYSADNGTTWSDALWVDKNATGNESEPCVVVNKTSGAFHIVYTTENGTGGNTSVFYNRVWAGNWTAGTPALVDGDLTTNASQPYIARTIGDGVLRIAWRTQPQSTGYWRINFTNATSDGDTLATGSTVFADELHNQSWPCLATDRNDTIHLTYSEVNTTDGRWDLNYTRRVDPHTAAWSGPRQVDEETTYNQVEAKIVTAGPVTIGSDIIEGKMFFWTEQNNTSTVQEVHWTFGDTGRNGTPNVSAILSLNGTRVTASANLSGFRAVWTDTDDNHLHHTFLNTDVEGIRAINFSAYSNVTELLAALSNVVNYAIDDELPVDLNYTTYNDTWASLMWYYDSGNNTIDKMVFTHGNNTYVVFYDFNDEWTTTTTTDPYAWVTNLITLIIAVIGVFVIVIVLTGMIKGLNKSVKT
ncbi:MAG: exo-alpha-sialidase [Thermoplasmata archaeon]|nr:exo-alpha-sialidase [Thermoplasmata archaeon]